MDLHAVEKQFIKVHLTKIGSSQIWKKHSIPRGTPSFDTFFTKTRGTELEHRFLETHFDLPEGPFSVTIRLTFKKKSFSDKPADPFQRKHRITLQVIDYYRQTGMKTVCDITFDSSDKNSKEYRVLKKVFQEIWDRAFWCIECEATNRYTALSSFIDIIKKNKKAFR